jgi:hypothetical protein
MIGGASGSQYRVKQRTLDDLRIESGLEIYLTHLLQQQI